MVKEIQVRQGGPLLLGLEGSPGEIICLAPLTTRTKHSCKLMLLVLQVSKPRKGLPVSHVKVAVSDEDVGVTTLYLGVLSVLFSVLIQPLNFLAEQRCEEMR